ncbi:aminoglycoside phosphotransferase family protein, partial [Streptomyces rochei]|nr:aminoglycoside phosphotransferase family protein [Streptomyces rochei]
ADRPSAPAGAPLSALRTRLRRAWEPILLERVTELRGDDPDEGPPPPAP